MADMLLSGCFGNPCLGGWPDTKMLTTPSGYAMIRRCIGLSAAKQPRAARHRQARWGVLRRAGSRRKKTYPLSPIFQANGSSVFMVAILLDMDSSVSPTHGEQEHSVWNGHYDCTCYHPLFVFNQYMAIWNAAPCAPAMFTAPMDGRRC